MAIGTSSGADDISTWSNNGLSTVVSHLLTNPVYDQMYYISVKAKNGAGLIGTSSSDGQRYVDGNLGLSSNDLDQIIIYPNPAVNEIIFRDLKIETTILVYDINGKLILTKVVTPTKNTINVSSFAQGSYNVVLKVDNQMIIKKLIKQ